MSFILELSYEETLGLLICIKGYKLFFLETSQHKKNVTNPKQ